MRAWLKELLGDSYTRELAEKMESKIGEGYVPKRDYETLEAANVQLKQEVTTRDAQIAELSKVDPEQLQGEITRLQEQNRADKEAYEAQLRQTRLDAAVDTALVESKARNHTAVRALLDLDKVELDGSGKVKGLKEQLKKLTEAEDTAFLFQPETAKFKGLKAGESFKPPGEVDISKMSYEELAGYMEANPDAQI